MVKDSNNSVFIQFFGQSVDLTPLLGQRYNDWIPLLILIFGVIFLFNIHGRILRLFGLAQLLDITVFNDENLSEGKELISQARTMKERLLARSDNALSSHDLDFINNNPNKPNAPKLKGPKGETLNTQDFLAKYKSQQAERSTSVQPIKSNHVDSDHTSEGTSSVDDESRALLLGTSKPKKTNVTSIFQKSRTEATLTQPGSSTSSGNGYSKLSDEKDTRERKASAPVPKTSSPEPAKKIISEPVYEDDNEKPTMIIQPPSFSSSPTKGNRRNIFGDI
jgi:hypothetical protein